MGQTLSHIRQVLADHGLRPKKRLGQNFLHDAHHMVRIVDAAAIEPGERVLEVGAGTGALSQRLLEAGAALIAIEIDRDLEPILRDLLEPWGEQAKLIIGDVLASKGRLAGPVAEALSTSRFKLVANLPYNIASPLLVNLALDWPGMTRGVVMVQREVAARLAAGPGGGEYGPLGILVQAACEVKPITTLSPRCFWPSPEVESAVVQLDRRPHPLCPDMRALAQVVHTLFQKRRKQIGGTLGRDRITTAGLDPKMRPEQLSIQDLSNLARSGPADG